MTEGPVLLFADDGVLSNGLSEQEGTQGVDMDDGQWQEVRSKNRATHVTREVCTSLIPVTCFC